MHPNLVALATKPHEWSGLVDLFEELDHRLRRLPRLVRFEIDLSRGATPLRPSVGSDLGQQSGKLGRRRRPGGQPGGGEICVSKRMVYLSSYAYYRNGSSAKRYGQRYEVADFNN